jgi:hypothetical protein
MPLGSGLSWGLDVADREHGHDLLMGRLAAHLRLPVAVRLNVAEIGVRRARTGEDLEALSRWALVEPAELEDRGGLCARRVGPDAERKGREGEGREKSREDSGRDFHRVLL